MARPKEPICRKCGRKKIGKNRTTEGRCRHCRDHFQRTVMYTKNKKYYVWKGNESKQRLVEKNQRLLIEYLSTHPCVDCGEKDIIVLDFDHRVMADKKWNVSVLLQRSSFEKVLVEIAKCDVRCANCHRRKTAREGNHIRYRLQQQKGANA